MDKAVFIGGGALLLLVVVAVLAQWVGGIGARLGTNGVATMEISEPVVLGVPTRVDWSDYDGSVGRATLEVRTRAGRQDLWTGSVATRQAFVIFPCSVSAPASVDLRDSQGALVAHKSLKLFKAGADCF